MNDGLVYWEGVSSVLDNGGCEIYENRYSCAYKKNETR